MTFPYYLGIGIIIFIILLLIYVIAKKDDSKQTYSDDDLPINPQNGPLTEEENARSKVKVKDILWGLFIIFVIVDLMDKIKSCNDPLQETFSLWDVSLFLIGLLFSVILREPKV